MRSAWSGKLLDIVADALPHWIVDHGCYAVTIRCTGSLPQPVRDRLLEISQSLRAVPPASSQAEEYRRKQFAILEQALDSSEGFAPFANPSAAEKMTSILARYSDSGLRFAAWVVMPNHLHLLTHPVSFREPTEFLTGWRRFKQSTAVQINRHLGRKGEFWQSHWYDRWVRNPTEYQKWLQYFQNNPMKAGLCSAAEEYPYMQIADSVPE